MSQLVRPLFLVLLAAVVVEFLLLRVFLRLGPVLPGEEALLPLYQAGQTLGLVALNLAMLAGAVWIAVVAAGLSWGRPGQALLGLVLLAALGVNLGLFALLEIAPGPWVLMLHAGLTAAGIAAVAASAWGLTRGRAVIGLAAGAQLLALYHVFTQGALAVDLPLPGRSEAILAAEGLAVAAALALPWSLRLRPARWDLGWAMGLAIFFLAFYVVRPWIAGTISMWTVSFSLSLPALLYPAALGVAAAALLVLRRQSGGGLIVGGLLLVAMAGLKLDFTYFALVGLAGLVGTARFLAQPAPTPAVKQVLVGPRLRPLLAGSAATTEGRAS